jgi:hypothetical protein
MDDGPNVQLNQRKIAFQVSLQERAGDAFAGVQRQHVHRPASLQYRRGDALIAVERGQVCMERSDGCAPGPQALARFVCPVGGDYEDLEVLLGAHFRELIADTAGSSGDDSELSAFIGVHDAS